MATTQGEEAERRASGGGGAQGGRSRGGGVQLARGPRARRGSWRVGGGRRSRAVEQLALARAAGRAASHGRGLRRQLTRARPACAVRRARGEPLPPPPPPSDLQPRCAEDGEAHGAGTRRTRHDEDGEAAEQCASGPTCGENDEATERRASEPTRGRATRKRRRWHARDEATGGGGRAAGCAATGERASSGVHCLPSFALSVGDDSFCLPSSTLCT
ncbi:hypothetical protein PR202_gb27645 [Eleusine coracana subsp. coracana]|uniref:Uncharacterized protein n=1 Tax=Eleusine coracana subsp. coracana TaxID=191504 RepID=A0AAV5FUZ4_ELECO|nr:hypothetical protein PR202_gb27645 [Eleusine coracana subsp. coracana]